MKELKYILIYGLLFFLFDVSNKYIAIHLISSFIMGGFVGYLCWKATKYDSYMMHSNEEQGHCDCGECEDEF